MQEHDGVDAQPKKPGDIWLVPKQITVYEEFRACGTCATPFTSKFPHAKFCSDKCKASAWRKRQREKREAERVNVTD